MVDNDSGGENTHHPGSKFRKHHLKRKAETFHYHSSSSSSLDSDPEPFKNRQKKSEVKHYGTEPGLGVEPKTQGSGVPESTSPLQVSPNEDSSSEHSAREVFADELVDIDNGEYSDISDEESDISDQEIDTSNQKSDTSNQESDHSDSESSSDDDNQNVRQDIRDDGAKLLYLGAILTVFQFVVAIMSFAQKHSLTGVCIGDLLKLIAPVLPPDNLCVTSLYKLQKFFCDADRKILIYHYYYCGCYVLFKSKTDDCAKCPSGTEKYFFIEVPIVKQLQSMYMRPNFLENLQWRFNRTKQYDANIEDLYDGRIYKHHVEEGFLGNPHISFMWYSDGVSVFKSSKFAIWPLYLVINELSYKKRVKRENILLGGLWFGPSKPVVNTFLCPIHKDLKEFEKNGSMFKLPDNSVTIVTIRSVAVL